MRTHQLRIRCGTERFETQSILVMGGKVELMIANSVKSLVERDTPLAERTIAMDHEVNAAEVSIDERCMELLALRYPAYDRLKTDVGEQKEGPAVFCRPPLFVNLIQQELLAFMIEDQATISSIRWCEVCVVLLLFVTSQKYTI